MPNFPVLKRGRPAARYQLGRHLAVVYTGCETIGGVKYPHVLFVMKEESAEPLLAVAAEVNARHTAAGSDESGSHFLGVFTGDTHVNLGDSDDWGHLAAFTRKALGVAARNLGVPDNPQEIT